LHAFINTQPFSRHLLTFFDLCVFFFSSLHQSEMAAGKRLSLMASFTNPDSKMKEAGIAFNRALQKLAMTLKAKPVGKGESSAGPTSFVDKLKFVYDKYDPDNDGLDINEFKNAMETEGVEGMPPEMIDSVFLILDPDHDGTVTLDEFTYAYFNRRKLQYAAGGETQRLEVQAKLRNKRRKVAIKKLMFDKFMREREACLPPPDPTRDNVAEIEAEMSKLSGSAVPAEVNKDFDPNGKDTEDKVAWSFKAQNVPLMAIRTGEVVLIIKKGCGRDRRWCVGMSADRSTWGFFPMWCVDHMKSFLKLHDETRLLQERQKLRDAQREAKIKKQEQEEMAKCSFAPKIKKTTNHMGAKKSEVVAVEFDAQREAKLVAKAFPSTNGPPAPPITLNVGDRVEVLSRRIGLNGRWCLGRLPRVGNEISMIQGVFPRWCIGENSHFNRMHEEGHRMEKRRHVKKEQLETERDDEFTFHPKTNRRKNLRMLRGYEERREEREQKRIDKHIDHLFKECTFKPKLIKAKHHIASTTPRPESFYMRKKEKIITLAEPTLNSQGRLAQPVHALVIKPFQWNRNGAVSQMLVPAFGKNHPKPVQCYIKDKVLVLDTMCGRDGRWCLVKLGKDTGVCPMWVLPKNFQKGGKKKRFGGSGNGGGEEEGGDLDNTFDGNNTTTIRSMRSPQPPNDRSPDKTSPNARRKKNMMQPPDSMDVHPPRKVYGKESFSEKRQLAQQIPGIFIQIKKGLKDRASTLKKAFLMLDTDHNKVVNRHEFKAWLRKYGLVKLPKTETSDRLLDMVFARMDVDKDGQITFAEFAKRLQQVNTDITNRNTH